MRFEEKLFEVINSRTFCDTQQGAMLTYSIDWLRDLPDTYFDLDQKTARALFAAGCLDDLTASIALACQTCGHTNMGKQYLLPDVYESFIVLQETKNSLCSRLAQTGDIPALRYLLAMECAGLAPYSHEQHAELYPSAVYEAAETLNALRDKNLWHLLPRTLVDAFVEKCCDMLEKISGGASHGRILADAVREMTQAMDHDNRSGRKAQAKEKHRRISIPHDKKRFRL